MDKIPTIAQVIEKFLGNAMGKVEKCEDFVMTFNVPGWRIHNAPSFAWLQKVRHIKPEEIIPINVSTKNPVCTCQKEKENEEQKNKIKAFLQKNIDDVRNCAVVFDSNKTVSLYKLSGTDAVWVKHVLREKKSIFDVFSLPTPDFNNIKKCFARYGPDFLVSFVLVLVIMIILETSLIAKKSF